LLDKVGRSCRHRHIRPEHVFQQLVIPYARAFQLIANPSSPVLGTVPEP
jgi:hypothetical protein